MKDLVAMLSRRIDTVELLAREGRAYFDRHITAAALQPDGIERSIPFAECNVMLLDCALGQLDNLVDAALLSVGNRLQGELSPAQLRARMRTRRQTLIGEIEAALGASFDELPSWHDLEQLHDKVNALKHRSGLTIAFSDELDAPDHQSGMTTRHSDDGAMAAIFVETSPEVLANHIAALREWIEAIDSGLSERSV